MFLEFSQVALLEFLSTKIEFNTIFSTQSRFPFFSTKSNKIAAASLPISNAGWVMVLKEGFKKAAVCMFEKQITFSPSGTFKV